MAAANSALAQQNSTITAQCLGLTIDKSKITLTQGNRAPPKVSVLRDHLLDYPELWLDVFVAGPPYEERQFAELFARARCKRATTVETADLVVLTGGPDVDPRLYGEKPHDTTRVHVERDKSDIAIFDKCMELGIPMLGICRGAQLGNVLMGGKLFQDVDEHYGEHGIYDVVNKTAIPRISSVHHQAVIANPEIGMEVIAVCNKSTARWLNDMDCDVGKRQDVEAFFFRDACFLGIQGHPEYRGYNQFAKWTLDLIQSYIVCSPDLHWQNSQYRIKPDLVAQRNAGWAKRKKSITKPLTITQTKKGTN